MEKNRISIQYDPNRIAESILVLERVNPESEMLGALVPELCLMAEMLRAANSNIREIVLGFAQKGTVEIDDTWLDDEFGISADLEAAYVAFGLRELAADKHGLEDALLVHALLEWLDASGCWHVRVQFGGHKTTTAEIVGELRGRVAGFAAAEERQVDEDPDLGDPTIGDGVTDGPFGPFLRVAQLPELSNLGAAARELLQLSGLSWPCELAELKQAFRQLARAHHPDRRPGDPDAARRFAAINAGYLELASLLHEGGVS